MNILHLSRSSEHGTAYRLVCRLSMALRQLGHDSSMLVAAGPREASIRHLRPPSGTLARMRRQVRRCRIQWEMRALRAKRARVFDGFSSDRSYLGPELLREINGCDVLHLHFVSGLIDFTSFLPAITRRLPVVWTLHDMNAFTGGCHYDNGCGGYATGCGACPQLGTGRRGDVSARIAFRKKVALEQVDAKRLRIVSPSHWLAAAASASQVMRPFHPLVIPYGIDRSDFKPRGKRIARDLLGLPQEAKVVLFVAQYVSTARKGFAYLSSALRGLSDIHGIHLLSLGAYAPRTGIGLPLCHLGRLEQPRLLSLAYSAADLLVVPSVQDNLPNVILEAMACGTPIVAFNTGGIPDLVHRGRTGLLARVGDVDGLAGAIRSLLEDQEIRDRMSVECCQTVETKYTSEQEARHYEALYADLTGSRVIGHQGQGGMALYVARNIKCHSGQGV